jgi:hypothetical protein
MLPERSHREDHGIVERLGLDVHGMAQAFVVGE